MFISEKVMRRYRQVYIESHHDDTEFSQNMLKFIESRYPGVEEVCLTIPYMEWLESQGFPDKIVNIKQVIEQSNEFSYHTAEEIMKTIKTPIIEDMVKIPVKKEVFFGTIHSGPEVAPIVLIIVIPLAIAMAAILLLI